MIGNYIRDAAYCIYNVMLSRLTAACLYLIHWLHYSLIEVNIFLVGESFTAVSLHCRCAYFMIFIKGQHFLKCTRCKTNDKELLCEGNWATFLFVILIWKCLLESSAAYLTHFKSQRDWSDFIPLKESIIRKHHFKMRHF